MRRLAPRSLATALARLRVDLEPATTLARLQGLWESAVGPVLAAEATPLSERAGVVTVGCRSSVWAQELALMSPELVERVNGALDAGARPSPVHELRFVVRGR